MQMTTPDPQSCPVKPVRAAWSRSPEWRCLREGSVFKHFPTISGRGRNGVGRVGSGRWRGVGWAHTRREGVSQELCRVHVGAGCRLGGGEKDEGRRWVDSVNECD
jgi:hypothetical protein